MKNKLMLLSVFVLLSLVIITGCTKKETPQEEKAKELNSAEKLAEVFKKEIKNNDLESVAKIISENDLIEIDVETFKIKKDDYLAGFTTEIEGFNEAYSIRPMIGSIPFIAYVFESDNAIDLEKDLKENADLRWNICTEADLMTTEVVDNYVFFVMMPSEF